MRITSPACFYHIESLSWDQLNNQEGWVPVVGDLYYGINPIPLDDSKIILLDRPFIKMDFIRSRVTYIWLKVLSYASYFDASITAHLLRNFPLNLGDIQHLIMR